MITPSQRQILEAVLEALPINPRKPFDIDTLGYDAALSDVRAIINEFLEPELFPMAPKEKK